MAQGGEFAFVLYGAATAVGIIDGQANAILTAIIIVSMILTPFAIAILRAFTPKDEQTLEGVEIADGLNGSVLIIGFGRFGQIVSQPLLLRGVDVSIIDNDVEMIQAAADFGFKVYYGDGTRPDILHAAGAGRARAVLICVDKAEAAVRIAENIKADFPLVPVLARAYDRGAALGLINVGVDYQIRETFESALLFGGATLEKLGVEQAEVAGIIEDVRRRDAERLELQISGGLQAGRRLMKGNIPEPTPTPLTPPKRPGQAMNEGAADALGSRTADRPRRDVDMAELDPRAAEIVAFWRDAGEDAWFAKNAEFDARFHDDFRELHFAAARRELDHWIDHPDSALALMILLDQFPRNCFRGTAHMFATDPLARYFARKSLDAGHDKAVEKQSASSSIYRSSIPRTLADHHTAVERAIPLGEEYGETRHRAPRDHRALRTLPAPQSDAWPRDDT